MTKRKDGLWQESMMINVNGRPVRKYFYGHSKAEVLRKISAYREERESGRSFRAVAEDWWREAEPELSPTTAKSYRPAKERAVEYFDITPIRQITPNNITVFMKTFVKEHRPAAKTAGNQLCVLRLICKYAIAEGDLTVNPAADITIPKNLARTKRKEASENDVEKIKRSTSCRFGMFAYWLLYTGLRRGELLALTWEDVDLQSQEIRIDKTVYYVNTVPFLKAPKTEAGRRSVPLPDRLKERLEPGKGLIFPDPKTGGLMPEHRVRRLWAAYQSESGVSCTPHQLRHLYATMLYEANIPEKDAQEIMGHADISTTRDIYTHIRDSRRRKINTILRGIDA